ncbi:unnamed protein product [Heterosigma akashiwo]
MELISQGAEARIYSLPSFMGRPAVVKERFSKSYRSLPVLDLKITSKRTIQEVRCMAKCRKAGIDTPLLLLVDTKNSKIYMEKIPGMTVRQFLVENMEGDMEACLALAGAMGAAVAKMHDAKIVHGDLTTSNFMLRGERPSEGLVVVDFGLGNLQPLPEDKAVDLYVLERALVATHAGAEPLVDEALRAYKALSRTSDAVLQRLFQVRQRGRKRECFG